MLIAKLWVQEAVVVAQSGNLAATGWLVTAIVHVMSLPWCCILHLLWDQAHGFLMLVCMCMLLAHSQSTGQKEFRRCQRHAD